MLIGKKLSGKSNENFNKILSFFLVEKFSPMKFLPIRYFKVANINQYKCRYIQEEEPKIKSIWL